MPSPLAPYGQQVWAAGTVPSAVAPGSTIPPPIPRGTTSYLASAPQVPLPWAYIGWGGAVPPVSYLSGGLIVVPDADNAVTQVHVWWPNTAGLLLVRTGSDGVRVPVRGAYPLAATGATRTNYAQNPSARAALNGYQPGTGFPTLSRTARTDIQDEAWVATIASAGTCEVLVPQALPGSQQVTIGVDLAFSGRPTTVTVTLAWVDGSGNALTSSSASLSAAQINACVGQFGRQVVWLQPPPGAANCSSMKITATGLPAGASMSGGQVSIEEGQTDGSPVDGDALGGLWTGPPDLSVAVLAPIEVIADGECPLDVPITYTVFDPAINGGHATSPLIVLPSNGQSWLTHPATPDSPVACFPTAVPDETYDIPQAILPVIGRRNPVVVSASQRQSAAGTLVLDCATFSARYTLLGLLADGQPVLLRTPGEFGYAATMWIAVGKLSVTAGGRGAWQQTRAVSAPYQVVDPPSIALVA